MDSLQLKQILKLYFVVKTTSSVKLFEVTVQYFFYNYLFTIVFFGKRKKSQNLSHFENEPHFENES